MFSFLFKYPESSWRQSELIFGSDWPLAIYAVLMVVIAIVLAVSLVAKPLSMVRKSVVWLLQFLVLGLLLTALWEPMLRVKVVEPDDNGLSIMLDTSRSMAYQDGKETRIIDVQQAIEQTGLLDTLSADYDLELLSVAKDVSSLETNVLSQQSVSAEGEVSALGDGLLEVVQSASARVLSAVVLISDGGDTTDLDPSWWQRLSEAQVPVYTIGTGETELRGDLSIASIDIGSSAPVDAPVSARVGIRYAEPGDARLRIYDGEKLLYAESVALPEGSSEVQHIARILSGEAGLRDLRFELEPKAGEKNLTNNSQRRILSVKPNKRRILYVEGEPRWEFKFIRRALHESPEIELVTLLHTSPNKFYRQGVRSAEELSDGFPTDQQQLFSYDAIIIGSLEAAKLSELQQQSLRDFVRVRGGSLMMLAGSSGLSDGGWSRTVVAQALPVVMPLSSNAYSRKRLPATITELGLETDWLRLGETKDTNLERWQDLPLLADFQNSGRPKAGATVLLELMDDGDRLPLLSWQRYGRGKTYVMATSGTWRWQMGLPSDDQRHEQFWQGLLGELVSGVLPRLSVDSGQSVYFDQAVVKVTVDARNANFEPDSTANLDLELQGPGETKAIELRPDPSVPGRFHASVLAEEEGEYNLAVNWSDGVEDIAQNLWFLRQNQIAEDYALALNESYLQRIAAVTGGRYLPLEDLSSLPGFLNQSESRLVRNELLPLWNLPVVFLVLFLLKMLEWLLRLRWKHL